MLFQMTVTLLGASTARSFVGAPPGKAPVSVAAQPTSGQSIGIVRGRTPPNLGDDGLFGVRGIVARFPADHPCTTLVPRNALQTAAEKKKNKQQQKLRAPDRLCPRADHDAIDLRRSCDVRAHASLAARERDFPNSIGPHKLHQSFIGPQTATPRRSTRTFSTEGTCAFRSGDDARPPVLVKSGAQSRNFERFDDVKKKNRRNAPRCGRTTSR